EFNEQLHWKGAAKEMLDSAKVKEEQEWAALSMREKVHTWALQNQYKVILGSWAISMGIAAGLIMRDRHQSTSQKIVQARMWAQGLTIGVLIGAGILTHSQRQAAVRPVDHSWKDLLEANARDEEARKVGQLARAQHAP
ncbi:hypothetical protein EWM64_g10652, partial [Hericium alpestre]